ncbi:MAG TPA: hypothetical protein VIS94_03195 [Desulfomonilia bacterium]
MQKERLIFNDGFGVVRTDGLEGRLVSAFPSTKKIMEVCHGRQVLFKVDGMRINTVNSKCVWSIN